MLLVNRRAFCASTFAFAASAALFAGGCTKPVSPAVGTWTGKTPVTGSTATMTLAADGTGTVSIPPIMQNKPIGWTEMGEGKIGVSLSPPAGGGADDKSAAASGGGNYTMTAVLSNENKTLNLAFPAFTVILSKSDDAAK